MIENLDPGLCTGCGTCVDACPMDVIRMEEDSGTARVVYPEDCMTCYNCERLCPATAVRVSPYVKHQPRTW